MKPVVHVEPYVQLNPDSPFSERFRVSNDGNFEIDDVSFQCLLINVTYDYGPFKKGGGIVLEDLANTRPSYIKTIPAPGSMTIDCPFDEDIHTDEAKHYISAEMEFRTVFKPFLYLWTKQFCFRFVGVLNTQEQVVWTYEDNQCTDILKLPFMKR